MPTIPSRVKLMKDMSLRDYFAAMALQGLIASPNGPDDPDLVDKAYNIADEMMEEQERQEREEY